MEAEALEVDVAVGCKQKPVEVVVDSGVELFIEVVFLSVLEANENGLFFVSADHIDLVVLLR